MEQLGGQRARPVFKFTKWSCHPPGECASAPAGFATHFEVNNNNTPCHGDTGRTSIDITTHVNTFDNGDQTAWWVRDGHCTYLDYPHDSKIETNGCPWGPTAAQRRQSDEVGGDWHEGCDGYGTDGDDRFAYAIPPS